MVASSTDRSAIARRIAGRAAVVALLASATLVATAIADEESQRTLLNLFPDGSGKLQSLSPASANAHGAFFASSIGTNGQACVTCHQPSQGISINVAAIDQAFVRSKGLDPLFRPSDTADRPDADISSLVARRKAYRLFLEMGLVRIGKTFKGNSDPDNPAATQSDFRVEHQDTPQFGPQPIVKDPQHPGVPSLALFRRPLVNSNVSFDSAVLWDGRDRIDSLATSQVPKAIQSLLLGPGSDKDANQQIADFMTATFTDQVADGHAGDLSAEGAAGGVKSLQQMASDPRRPCLYAVAFPQIAGLPQPGQPTLTPFSVATCTRVDANDPQTFGFDLFAVWANLPKTADPRSAAARAAIARGEVLFNTAVLHQPADLDGKLLDVASTANGGAEADHPDRIPAGQPIHCVTCHATHNLGNNPNPNFIGRIGTDSVEILKALAATRKAQDPLIDNVLRNAEKLPLYCLRPNSDPAPFESTPCGTHPGDIKTTDPGRAMVTGLIADAGKFKPPILRNLSARLPLFHAGTAATILDLIDFYDARFQINLTKQQKSDLAKFLAAL
jgi:cytochrome c peroxidase